MLKTLIQVLWLVLGITFSTSLLAAKPPTTDIKIEQVQESIRQLKQEVTAAKSELNNQDKLSGQIEKYGYLEKRIEDIHQSVATYDMIVTGAISVFGILMTGLILFFSLNTAKEARIEARLEAEVEFKQWIDKNGAETLQTLLKTLGDKGEQVMQPLQDSLRTKGEEFLQSFDQKANDTIKKIQDRADQQHQDNQEQIEQLLKRATPSLDQGGDKKPLSASDTAELNRLAEELKSKPPSSYTFDDWRVLYLEAASRKAFDEIEPYVAKMEQMAISDWQHASAIYSRSWFLGVIQNNYNEAIKLIDQLVSRFTSHSDPQLQELVTSALINKGAALGELGQWQQAIAVYDDAISHYGNSTEVGIVEIVASALFNKGVAFGEQGQWQQSITAYDDVVSRYGNRTEVDIVALVASALLNKGITLGEQGQWQHAIAVYDDLVSRYGGMTEASIVEQVIKALFDKGAALGEQGQWQKAIAVYDDVVARYGSRTEAAIVEEVKRARENREYSLKKSIKK